MTAYSAVYDQTPSYIKDRLQNYVTGPSGLAGGSSIEAQKYPLVFTASVFWRLRLFNFGTRSHFFGLAFLLIFFYFCFKCGSCLHVNVYIVTVCEVACLLFTTCDKGSINSRRYRGDISQIEN